MNELKCSLIFRETITKDQYIYLEEAEALANFEFWPHKVIDIEKPSSVSEEHEFIWRVPLHLEPAVHSQYIKAYNVTQSGCCNYEISLTAQYPFHFRYQPIKVA